MRRDHSVFWHYALLAVARPVLFSAMKRDWRGREHMPGGGVIVATNHISEVDPLAIGHYVYKAGRWPVFLGKSELFETPVLGGLFRGTGQIPVYRGTKEAGYALRDAERAIADGACVIFYPESTCTRDPDLWPMMGKTGVARLALATGAPVIPVGQWGPQEILRYGEKRIHLFPRKTVHLLAGPPVDLSAFRGGELSRETLQAATAEVMGAITRLVSVLRGEPAPATLYDPHSGGAEKGEPQ
ncbi:MAG: lysophospholipid acyltransferase family protein [Streptosporangiaceae bacterium]